jgi:two-component system response regulator ResD
MSHPGRTFQIEELLRKVWTEKPEVGGDVLKNMICRLRQRLEEEPTGLHCILTIPGVGYKFEVFAERGTPKHRGRHIL